MNIFRRPDYKSETTQFLNQLKADRPGLQAGQREGLSLLWDKQVDREANKAYRAARVPQRPYVYFSWTK